MLQNKLAIFRFNRDKHKDRIVEKFTELSKEEQGLYLKAVEATGIGRTSLFDTLAKAYKRKEN